MAKKAYSDPTALLSVDSSEETPIFGESKRPLPRIKTILIDSIEPDPDQPRRTFDEESLSELSENVKQAGIKEPLEVREAEPGRYVLIDGERRWRASKVARLIEVPALVYSGLEDADAAEIQIGDVLYREDYSPVDKGWFIKRFKEKNPDRTWDEIAVILKSKKQTLLAYVRTTTLSEGARELTQKGEISLSAAKEIASLPDHEQEMAARRIADEKIPTKKIREVLFGQNDPIDETSSAPMPPAARPKLNDRPRRVACGLDSDIISLVEADMQNLKIKNYADYLRRCIERRLRDAGLLN